MEDRPEPQPTSSDETARQFKTIVTHVVDGVLVVDMAGTVCFANPAAEVLLARAGAELIGTNLGQPVVAGESTEMTLIRENGRPATIELRAASITWEGAPATLASLRDISERKQAEAQVESLSRFPAENPHPILRAGADGILLFANPSAGPLVASWGCKVGQSLPQDWVKRIADVLATGACLDVDIACGSSVYTITLTPFPTLGYANLYGHDITASKRAQHDLEASETRYRRLFEAAKDGILMLDATTGKIVDVNPFLIELTGYTRDDFLGAYLWEIGPFKDTANSKESFATLLTDKYVRYDDLPLLAKDGRKIDVEFVSNVYRVDGQSVIQCNIRDITERKRAAETLASSEARYRSYIVATGQIGWVTNPDGEVVEDVPSLRQFTGQTFEEIKGSGWVKALHPDDLEQALQAWKSALATKSAYEVEYRMRRHDGVYRHLLARGSPVLRTDGSIREWVGTCIDITERKRVEEALLASESEFRALAEAMPQIVWITRPDGWNIFFNQQWMDYTGLSLEQSLGHGWNIPFHPDDQQRAWDAWKKATSENGTYSIESRLRRADGAYRWWLVRGVPKLDAAGNITKWYGTCTDIHDLKMAEKERQDIQMQLQASQKMEAIGGLAGGVAHDFNNLLSVILSYIGFAMGAVRDGDPLKNDLLEVKNAADRAVALTRQLLAFGRKQVLQPASMSLNQIATGVEKMLRRILGADIDFVQALAPDLGVVRADPGQIEQVIMNLVVNARDAMPEGGKLTIETSNVEVDEEYAATHVAVKPGSYVQLAVTDTGCGMDEQTRARIFEPFFTTKKQGKGTGLGLSTAYGIVKQSGGNIWVYSELGQGTTFKIYLPRELSATTATVIRHSTAVMRSKGTETILVVEDEEALRKVAKRSLEAAGYRVLTAADGPDALRVSAEHAGDIHLLLTDVVMPRMGGRAVAQELLKTRPTLKVVYMSGYTDDAIVHHGVLDAGTHFLAKPFTSADLTRKARDVLDSGITNLADEHEQPFKDEADKREHPLDKAALRSLSPDVLARLCKAVIAARYNEIGTIIETIRVTEPTVATELRRMADRFDYDGMRDLLSDGTESQRGR